MSFCTCDLRDRFVDGCIPPNSNNSSTTRELSGYDFGYLVKLLTAENLPAKEEEFFELFSIWFPIVYDVKFMMRACKGLKGGLQDVADDLGVRFIC